MNIMAKKPKAEIGVFSVYFEILSVLEQLWCPPVVCSRAWDPQ